MTDTAASLMQAVEEVARRAGNVALDLFRDRPPTEIKPDGSPVTEADRAAERTAREWIGAHFPADAIAGEEFGVTAGGHRRWLIDPIDGTKSFVRGVPLWGTLIAVCDETEVLAGAIYCPAAGEMMAAGVGEGCWLNGARCSVSTIATLKGATVLASGMSSERKPERAAAWRSLTERAAVARTWGDCFGYLMVASGRAEVMADPTLADWDSAAVQRCIVEAGGVFTDWDGRPTPFGKSAIATNANLADEVRRLLR